MPANQLFTDWVTGDLITAGKLNQMKNNLAALSGATFAGGVIFSGSLGNFTVGAWAKRLQLDSAGVIFWPGNGTYRPIGIGRTSDNQFGIITATTNDDSGAGTPSYPFLFDVSTGNLDVTGNITAAQLLNGRYDAATRFTLTGAVSSTGASLAAGATQDVGLFYVFLSAGKSLYLRRLRFVGDASLRARVVGANTYTSGSNPEESMNSLLTSASSSNYFAVRLQFYNAGIDIYNVLGSSGIWAEMEIV